jgi:hypothetical protein
MKLLPAPPVPGNTEAERFDNAVRKTFTVSKEEMQRREAEWQRTQTGKGLLRRPDRPLLGELAITYLSRESAKDRVRCPDDDPVGTY